MVLISDYKVARILVTPIIMPNSVCPVPQRRATKGLIGTMLLLWTQAMNIEEISPAVIGDKTPHMRISIEKSRPNLCFLERSERCQLSSINWMGLELPQQVKTNQPTNSMDEYRRAAMPKPNVPCDVEELYQRLVLHQTKHIIHGVQTQPSLFNFLQFNFE